MNQFRPVQRQNVVNMVFDQMLDKIIGGEWPPDSKIPSENELRSSLSVSRDTVREAIKRLGALGLLESKQGKGTFVRKVDVGFYLNLVVPSLFLDEHDSVNILQFMKAIQAESVRFACRKATEKDIHVLEDLLEKMKDSSDYEDYFTYDIGFHCYLSEITQNQMFVKSMDIASKLLHVNLKDIAVIHGSKQSIEQHKGCLEALAGRREEEAVKIMVRHYDMLAIRLGDYLKEKNEEKK